MEFISCSIAGSEVRSCTCRPAVCGSTVTPTRTYSLQETKPRQEAGAGPGDEATAHSHTYIWWDQSGSVSGQGLVIPLVKDGSGSLCFSPVSCGQSWAERSPKQGSLIATNKCYWTRTIA